MSNKALKISFQIVLYAMALALFLKPHHIIIPIYVHILVIIFVMLGSVYIIKRVYTQDELFRKVVPRLIYLGLFGIVGYLLAVNSCFTDMKSCLGCKDNTTIATVEEVRQK